MSHNISDHLSKLHRHTIITASPEAVVNMRIKAIRRVLKKQYVDIFFFYLLTVLGLALDLESLALSCLGPAKLQQAREKVERLDWDPSTHSISLSLFSIRNMCHNLRAWLYYMFGLQGIVKCIAEM